MKKLTKTFRLSQDLQNDILKIKKKTEGKYHTNLDESLIIRWILAEGIRTILESEDNNNEN